jgi:hypothetical protein
MKDITELEELNALMFHSKELVTFVKRSEIQRELETTLKQSVEVRWDSRLMLLESIKDNYEELKNIAEVNDKIEEHIIHINYELLCDLVKLLSPFHKYRLDLCFDTKPTFHLVVPTKQKLIKEYELKSTDSVIIKQIKESLKENLNQYFKQQNIT